MGLRAAAADSGEALLAFSGSGEGSGDNDEVEEKEEEESSPSFANSLISAVNEDDFSFAAAEVFAPSLTPAPSPVPFGCCPVCAGADGGAKNGLPYAMSDQAHLPVVSFGIFSLNSARAQYSVPSVSTPSGPVRSSVRSASEAEWIGVRSVVVRVRMGGGVGGGGLLREFRTS